MTFQKPSKITDIFSVFFLITQTNTLKIMFYFLFFFVTLNAGMIYIVTLLPMPGIFGFLVLLIDVYLVSICQMILSRNIDSYIQVSQPLTFSEVRMLIASKSFHLFMHPLLIFIFFVGVVFIASLHSLILQIDYVGTFFYSLTYVIFFALGVFFMLNIILGIASIQLTPTMVSERELPLVPLYKELGRLFYYSWPKLLLLNILQGLLTMFFTLVCLGVAITVIYLTLSISTYFDGMSREPVLMQLFYTFPGGESIIEFFRSTLQGTSIVRSLENYIPSYISTEYRIAGFFLGISMYLVLLLTMTFPWAYTLVSNYATYHIAKNSVRYQ